MSCCFTNVTVSNQQECDTHSNTCGIDPNIDQTGATARNKDLNGLVHTSRRHAAKQRHTDKMPLFLTHHTEQPRQQCSQTGKFREMRHLANEMMQAIRAQFIHIAEMISDNADIRKSLRQKMESRAVITVQAVDPEKESVYRNYYEFSSPVSRLQNHQILAINRGEKEEFLKVTVTLPGNEGQSLVCRMALKPTMWVSQFVKTAAEDAYNRLIAPSAERELRSTLTDRAGESAIANFALNLKPLLMQRPVKGFVTMGLDPGYRNGCKVAVVEIGKKF